MTTDALDAMFTPLRVGNVTIANRMAMAPMTRQRSLLDGTPTDLNVDLYDPGLVKVALNGSFC